MMQCHTCGHHDGTGVGETPATRRLGYVTIDMHCHVMVPEVEALVADHAAREADALAYQQSQGTASVQQNFRMRDAIALRLKSAEVRLADMDRLGIDIQVLSPSPMQYYTWAEPGLARTISDRQNRRISELVSAHPDRFVGLGSVPLQHPSIACEVLESLKHEHGLLGVEITSDPTGQGLDDPGLNPFWQKAEALGAVIFLHPMGTTLGQRVNRYYLSNIIGQPLETTIALSELIYSGVLDRYPGLKVCAAHGGGFLPFAVGRSDHGHGVRPEAKGCQHPPSHYLTQFWYDTVVFRPESVRALIDVVGVSRVVAGTDYPFDMGEYALHELIRRIPGAGAVEHEAILGRNAAALLGLDGAHPAVRAARTKLKEGNL